MMKADSLPHPYNESRHPAQATEHSAALVAGRARGMQQGLRLPRPAEIERFQKLLRDESEKTDIKTCADADPEQKAASDDQSQATGMPLADESGELSSKPEKPEMPERPLPTTASHHQKHSDGKAPMSDLMDLKLPEKIAQPKDLGAHDKLAVTAGASPAGTAPTAIVNEHRHMTRQPKLDDTELNASPDEGLRTSQALVSTHLPAGFSSIPAATTTLESRPINTEWVELVSKLADKLWVSGPDNLRQQEVRLSLKGDMLPDTQLRVAKTDNLLTVQFTTQSANSYQQLTMGRGNLVGMLQRRYGVDNVNVEVELEGDEDDVDKKAGSDLRDYTYPKGGARF